MRIMSEHVCRLCVHCYVCTVQCVTIFELLYTEDSSSSETDELFADVKEVIKEIRSDWYSLAIELDIDYATRKVRP